MTAEQRNAFDALTDAVRSRTGKILLLSFALLELLNLAVLPAALQTIAERTTAAKSITERAKGKVAELQQTSEAMTVTEDAATKNALAEQAERLRNAEARKADEEARAQAEIAKYSDNVQAAEAANKGAAAVIDNEKAKYEQRRAQAEAEKIAAEAKLAGLGNQLESAVQRANIITARVDAIQQCIKLKTQDMANAMAADMNNGVGKFYYELAMNSAARYRFWRKECLQGEDAEYRDPTPAVRPTGECVSLFRQWRADAPRYSAFATSPSNCGWATGQDTAAIAREKAIEACPANDTCRVYAEQ